MKGKNVPDTVKMDTDVPLQLEININRGFIRLHSLLTGREILHLGRISDELMQLYSSGLISLDLDIERTPVRRSGASTRHHTIKTDPVYIDINPRERKFTILNSRRFKTISVSSIPQDAINRLSLGQWVHLDIGHK